MGAIYGSHKGPKPSLRRREREAYHASRPGFRIAEYTINPTQKVPWHCNSNIQDTFYVFEGDLQIFLREPKE
jgi:hypothetical protein